AHAGTCFDSIINNRCANQNPQRMTKAQCCCSRGGCWARNTIPEFCPILGTEEFQILCQQVQPLVPVPIGPYVPPGPGGPGGPGTGPYLPSGPGISPYIPYGPYGPGLQIPVPHPDRPAVAPPLTSVLGNTSTCELVSNLCLNGRCIPVPGSYRCECNMGFRLDNRGECIDDDECDRNPCVHGQCINIPGSYYCQCPLGFQTTATRTECRDLDECVANGRICNNGRCVNTEGSFHCVCNAGFELTSDGKNCQ
ncbi:fibrillin-1, partial [Clarias magur]